MSQFQCYYDTNQKVWSGRQHFPIINPQVSIGHVLLNIMDRNPDKIIQISADSGIVYTNNDIRIRAIRTARFFMQQKLAQGDVVGIMAANSANLTPIAVACFACGLPFNSLDVTFGKSEITHMYAVTKPKIVFCDEKSYELVKTSLGKIGIAPSIYIIDGNVKGVPSVVDFMENENEAWEDFVCPVLDDPKNIPAAILCSSGTTGMPKGVYVSQASLIYCAEIAPVKTNDRLLCFSTLYWYSGVWTLMMNLLTSATRIITTEKPSSELILSLVEKYQVTFFMTPPSQMAMLLQDPSISREKLASVKKYMCGGSKVLPTLVNRMNKYLTNAKVSIMYGMTEAGTVCTINPGNEPLESVGLTSPNMQIKIVQENGSVADIGSVGEVYIKPPFRFLGYCGLPEETKAIFDDDGWIHSGDVGYFDKNGYLILVDRKKDILKYRNYHYFPSEIENVLMQIPEVAQTCVCGIPEEDGSDIPAALVIRAKGSNITEKYIFDYAASKLSHYKQLKGGIYFTDTIPMTASGKYQRRCVQTICEKLYLNRKTANGQVLNGNLMQV